MKIKININTNKINYKIENNASGCLAKFVVLFHKPVANLLKISAFALIFCN